MEIKYPLEQNIGIADEIRAMLDAGQTKAAALHWEAYKVARTLLKGVVLSDDPKKAATVDDAAVLRLKAEVAAEASIEPKAEVSAEAIAEKVG